MGAGAGKGGQLRRGSMLHCKAIAPKYGVTPKTIRDVWSGRSWAKTTRHLWTEEETRRRGAGEPEGDENDDDMGAHGAAHRLPMQGMQHGYSGGDFNSLNPSLMTNPFAGNMPGNFSNANQLGNPQQWFPQANNGGSTFVGAGMQPQYNLPNAMCGNFGGYNQTGMLADMGAANQGANGMGNSMGGMLSFANGMCNQQLGNFHSMSGNNNALSLGSNNMNIGSQGMNNMGMGHGGQVPSLSLSVCVRDAFSLSLCITAFSLSLCRCEMLSHALCMCVGQGLMNSLCLFLCMCAMGRRITFFNIYFRGKNIQNEDMGNFPKIFFSFYTFLRWKF